LRAPVVPLYPRDNAGLPPNTPARFAWKPVVGAAGYLLHIWMVQQSGSTAVSATTPLSLSTFVFGKAGYTWKTAGYLPGTYDYALLPMDRKGNALAPWSKAVQITI
jgi:hypothetical protein